MLVVAVVVVVVVAVIEVVVVEVVSEVAAVVVVEVVVLVSIALLLQLCWCWLLLWLLLRLWWFGLFCFSFSLYPPQRGFLVMVAVQVFLAFLRFFFFEVVAFFGDHVVEQSAQVVECLGNRALVFRPLDPPVESPWRGVRESQELSQDRWHPGERSDF